MNTDSYLKINGRKALNGEITACGSKNSVSALIPAMCLGSGEGKLYNTPVVSDVEAMQNILKEIGIDLIIDNSVVTISGSLKYSRLSQQYVSKIRASNLFLGVLLAKFGKASVPMSGGDKIGNRPIDIHLYVFNKFGIKTEIEDGYINCEATEFPYKGADVYLRYPSVGATENAMMIASTATSPSIIYNVAMEPEIVDLAVLLNSMGAQISGAGTPVLRIKPAPQLVRKAHEVIPDRLEAGTFLFMLAATRGKGIINNIIPEHLMSAIALLTDCGIDIKCESDRIIVDAANRNCNAINVAALPYPGFPTDLQPFAFVFSLTCKGKSIIADTVHRERFAYLYEISRMGMMYDYTYEQVTVNGEQSLVGGELEGNDIRAAAALVMAALIAKGESHVYGLKHLYRGYDNFIGKLEQLGADIELVL